MRWCARSALIVWGLALLPLVARAEARLQVSPETVQPGDAALVSVTGVTRAPRGQLAGQPLSFFRVRGGYQAVAAVPLDQPAGPLPVRVEGGAGGPLTARLEVRERLLQVRDVTVDDRFVHPSPQEQARARADAQAVKAAHGSPTSPPFFRRNFRAPVSAPLRGDFGDMWRFNGETESRHLGQDYAVGAGTPVHAANAGQVVLVRDTFLSGLLVIVHHGANLYTSYLHLAQAAVGVGQRVEQGEVLGRSGESGRASGPHFHLGATVGRRPVDPATLLALDLGEPLPSARALPPERRESRRRSR